MTEGEDKPLKYPHMFAASKLMILNKVDLLPYLNFDVEKCIAYAKQVNPTIEVIQLSSQSGEGLQQWLDWLKRKNDRSIKCSLLMNFVILNWQKVCCSDYKNNGKTTALYARKSVISDGGLRRTYSYHF